MENGPRPAPASRVDIVVATVGRTTELARLLESVAGQSYPHVRVIVVDQNDDDRVTPTLERLRERVPAVRLRSSPGLSRARNIGLRHLEGDIVAFADDDCWYPSDLVESVVGLFEADPDRDGVTVMSVDEAGSSSNARWDTPGGPLSRDNVWRRAISYTIFLQRRLVEAVGSFDEELGVGAGTAFGSGEETDYLLRALEQGFTLWYEPALAVFHPQTRRRHDASTIRAGRSYGMGMGRVLRKHGYPRRVAAYHAARALAGSALAAASGRPAEARFHLAVARGRMRGWHAL
jgi:glycosyltransferase involved in cell wall biosynthesis